MDRPSELGGRPGSSQAAGAGRRAAVGRVWASSSRRQATACRPAGWRRADEKGKVAGGRYVRMEIGGIDSLARACFSVGRFGLVRAAVARAEEEVRGACMPRELAV